MTFLSLGTSSNNVDNERDNDGFKVPSIITRINQKPAEKQKPIIKSCEPANFNIKLRHSQKAQVSETSDVSIIENDVSLNKKVIHVIFFLYMYVHYIYKFYI